MLQGENNTVGLVQQTNDDLLVLSVLSDVMGLVYDDRVIWSIFQ